MPDAIELTPEDGPPQRWPLAETRQTQGFHPGEPVRLEHGGEPAASLLIDDPDFLTDLHRIAGPRAAHLHDPGRQRGRPWRVAAAGGAAVALIAALYLRGIPLMSDLLAPLVPVAWEEHLGASVVELLAPPEARCEAPELQRAIDAIVARLAAAAPESRYRFQAIVIKDPMINALAAPGGPIIVFEGLLRETRSAEELAGVLAHEMAHVELRHGTRSVIQSASAAAIAAALSGDASGAITLAMEAGRTLAVLRYSREHETAADAAGLRRLAAARVDPAGMIAVFETLQARGLEIPDALAYLSTHPATDERLAALRRDRPRVAEPVALLDEKTNWIGLRQMCATAASGAAPEGSPGRPAASEAADTIEERSAAED
jgi:predicted Zn-dependent protease